MSDSRAAMISSAASLIGSQGLAATSFADVLADSGAPRGSIYHHFPDGKRQLTTEAVRWTSERVLAFQGAGTFSTATDVLERFIGMWRNVVVASHATAGCTVAGVTVDTPSSDDEQIDLVRATFESWMALLAEQLASVGVEPGRARVLATTTLAAMEGALVLCRAEGSVAPLDAVATEVLRLAS